MQKQSKISTDFLNHYFYNISKSLFLFKKLLGLIKNVSTKNGDIVVVTGSSLSFENSSLLSKHFIVLREWPSGIFSNYSTTKLRNFLYKGAALDTRSFNIKRRKAHIKAFYTKNKFLTNSNKIPSLVIFFLTKEDKKITQELKVLGIPCVAITDFPEPYIGLATHIIKCNFKDIFFQDFIINSFLKNV
jgi:ribosomal protein S2